jgi:hypothetical protein
MTDAKPYIRINVILRHLLFYLLTVLFVTGCHFTYDVNQRQPNRHWYDYGDLENLYHDENGGRPVSVVWWEQVRYVTPKKTEYAKTIRDYLRQGYRRIGYVNVQSERPLYEEDVIGLACDKGAQIIVASSSPAGGVPGQRPEVSRITTLHRKVGQHRYTFEMEPTTWSKMNDHFQFLGK